MNITKSIIGLSSILIMAGLILITSCGKAVIQVVQVTQAPNLPIGSIQVVGKVRASVAVQLVREYKEEIKPGITLKVISTETNFLSLYPDGVEFSDTLVQKDGRQVDFDCDYVADKILNIDNELVPIINAECKTLHAVSLDYWKKSPPTEFNDESGRVWVLKK